MKNARRFIKDCLLLPLQVRAVRSRVLFWAMQEKYPEMDIEVPLSHGMTCPILSPEYWYSFSEIFVNGEYAALFDEVPLPRRWIDLGCHAGYFSLYTAWRRACAGVGDPVECLLVDADCRVKPSVERIVGRNRLPGLKFVHGGIGAGNGSLEFTERAFMASAASGLDDGAGRTRAVPVLSAAELQSMFRSPLDLVKVDVEGSEFELLAHYAPLLRQAKHLVLEWHSWHAGGGGKLQLLEMAGQIGFRFRREIQPAHAAGSSRECGVLLLANENTAPGAVVATQAHAR